MPLVKIVVFFHKRILVGFFHRAMLGSDELQKYDRARVFLDEDYTAPDKFTVSTLYYLRC